MKINISKFFLIIFSTLSLSPNLLSQTVKREFIVNKQYLNFPIETVKDRQKMLIINDNDTVTSSVIRLANNNTDYWVFKDISQFDEKKLELVFSESVSGIEQIYQSDKINGFDSLYHEKNRPQFHFTTKRGWNNDPNGLVYFDGEYHLFYQHNPYETNWENMHWGHAVSEDLIHWHELNDALYPDSLGTMFSGSAVIDKSNSAGWGENTLVAYYTAAGDEQTQCVAYSKDNGRTFTKYSGNPVLGGTRDPKIFWYEPNNTWVMVLYEKNTNAIYNSADLKNWIFKSRTKGFFECPELFELEIDGNKNNKKWVMYGASGTYMIGSFDGAKFEPEQGKYFYSWGRQYAAQTYNNTPDGRRIQIGWGRIEQPGMPFNQMMLFPCELTLRTTNEGVRMFCEPIEEIERLHQKTYNWNDIDVRELNAELKTIKSDLLHGKMQIEIKDGLGLEIHFKGDPIIYYDGNFNKFNEAPYICETPGSFLFDIEFIIDKTSVEAYIDQGKLFISDGLKKTDPDAGLNIKGDVIIHSFELAEMASIWR